MKTIQFTAMVRSSEWASTGVLVTAEREWHGSIEVVVPHEEVPLVGSYVAVTVQTVDAPPDSGAA